MLARLVVAYISVLLLYSFGVSAKYPSNLPKCKYGDTECIKNAIGVVIKAAGDGISEINLPKLNEIFIKSLEVARGNNQAVTISSTLSNMVLSGVDGVEINRVVGFDKDPNKSKFEIYYTTPFFQILADYKMSGKVLLFPIKGSGKCNMTSYDIENILKFKGKTVERDNKKYFEITKLRFQGTPKKVTLNFENLFNGDRVLGETMNKLINDNWKEIYAEMKEPIEVEVEKFLKDILNNIFSSHEYSEFFDNSK